MGRNDTRVSRREWRRDEELFIERERERERRPCPESERGLSDGERDKYQEEEEEKVEGFDKGCEKIMEKVQFLNQPWKILRGKTVVRFRFKSALEAQKEY